MGSGSSRPDKDLEVLQVVIIGGGYAGTTVAAECLKHGIPFKLISNQEYFHHCVGSLRAAVFPEYGKKIAIPLKDAFGAQFIQANVNKIDAEGKKVVLESGEEFEFTHCVIAVGSLGPSPARSAQATIDGLLSEYLDISDKISKAKHICIIGGGPVGVELAGEIRDKYTENEITIVSSNEKLVSPQFDGKFQTNMRAVLDAKNIKIEIGKATNVQELERNIVKEQNVDISTGSSLTCDLVISCVGLPPNKTSISNLISEDKLDQSGRIKVNSSLQIEGYDNMFAIGDCCNTEENKMAAYAEAHGVHAVKTIINITKGKETKAYKTPFVGMVIPVGAKQGVGIMNGYNIPGPIATVLKSRDLFTSKYWKMCMLEPPK